MIWTGGPDLSHLDSVQRRKYKRKEKPYRARFKIKSDEAQEMEFDDWDSVTLHNLRVGGIFFNGITYLANQPFVV